MVNTSASLRTVQPPPILTATPHREVVPLLRSRLLVPAPPANLVIRPRLARQLDNATGSLVTAVTAAAGWGKTTLLSSWVRGIRTPTAWLTLERDDDSDHFWPHLHAALSSWLDGNGEQLPVPAPGPGSRRAYLCELANALARRNEPIITVLDGLDQLEDPGVPEDLDFLLRHAEGRLRLVAATRTALPLALHRWRLSGEVTEVTTDDLAFTHAEVAQLMASHEIELPEADIATALGRTEGWAAGLRLLTLTMRGHPDPARWVDQFTGDQANVAEYLDREVLAQLPWDVRQILLSTSVSGRVHGGLVNALTQRTDGDRVLVEFARRNLFTVAEPEEPGWYRYHPLLAELLRSNLRRQMPQRLTELHRRAASWHAEQGLAPEALRHALAADDHRYASAVLAQQWPGIVLCRSADGPGTLVAPPADDTLRDAPDLALAYAADRLSDDDVSGAERYLRLADDHERRAGPEHPERLRLIRTAFHLAGAELRGEPATVMSTARRLLALVPGDDAPHGDDADQHLRARATALASLGAAELNSGDLVDAERSLSAGVRAAERAHLPCVRLTCTARLALVDAALGALKRAERAAHAVLHAPRCRGRCAELCRACAYLALAVVHYEWDRLVDAGRYLDLAAACFRRRTDPFVIVGIAIVRTAVLQAQSDLGAAYNVLRVVRRGVASVANRYLRDRLTVTEAELRTCAGDATAARALLTPMLDSASSPPAALAVPLGRAWLRDGNLAAAAAVLPDWADDASSPGPLGLRLEAGLLSALAAHRSGDSRRASGMVERVLALAEPEGFRRPFTRAGSLVRKLLADQLDAGTTHWAMILDLLGTATDPDGAGRNAPLTDPLTDRELTVLRRLQGMQSNQEIAGDLSVSVNTIKTHVRSIYRKLGVTRRREAIHKARDLELV